MAKQDSIFKIKGTIGGVTFYKSQDGHLAREKGGVEKSRIMSDPKFARTRENLREFTETVKSVKLLLQTIIPLSIRVADSRIFQRLVKSMMAILKTDPINNRGDRKISEGDWTLLKGMELNASRALTSVLKRGFLISDTATEFGVSIDSFLPSDFLMYPDYATHFKITLAAASVDFATGQRTYLADATPELNIKDVTAPIQLAIAKDSLPEPHALFILAVEFLQEANEGFVALKNMGNNTASVVEVQMP